MSYVIFCFISSIKSNSNFNSILIQTVDSGQSAIVLEEKAIHLLISTPLFVAS